MTSNADFTEDEWRTVLEGPPSAGMIVLTAQSGGSWSEMWAMSKAYVEARQKHGESELLDEIASAKPKMDRSRYGTPQELKDGCLQNLRDAVIVLEGKATAEEIDDYERFIVNLCHKVAAAHREGGSDVSPAESAAIDEIATTLGVSATG